jgi:hypothetical protein
MRFNEGLLRRIETIVVGVAVIVALIAYAVSKLMS